MRRHWQVGEAQHEEAQGKRKIEAEISAKTRRGRATDFRNAPTKIEKWWMDAIFGTDRWEKSKMAIYAPFFVLVGGGGGGGGMRLPPGDLLSWSVRAMLWSRRQSLDESWSGRNFGMVLFSNNFSYL